METNENSVTETVDAMDPLADGEAVEPKPEFKFRGFQGSEDPAAVPEAPKDVKLSAAVEPEAEVVPEDAKIKIGDKTFASREEAIGYAEELERAKLANDAYRQGIKDVLAEQKGYTPTTEPVETFEQDFYADPKAYLQKERERLKAEVKAEIEGAQSAKQKETETWSKFYMDNPDLVNARKWVDVALKEDWETLKDMDATKALKLVAEKVRAERRAAVLDLLPQRELPNKGGEASPGGQTSVTREQPTPEVLNFVQQARKLKAKRTARI